MVSSVQDYQKLEKIFSRIKYLQNTISILDWDVAVNLTSGSLESRSEQIAEMSSIINGILKSREVEDLLTSVNEAELDQLQKKNYRLMKRARNNVIFIDDDLLLALTKTCANSEMKWRVARKENNFKDYAPYLKEVLNLVKQKGQLKAELQNTSLYNALADDYEPGFDENQANQLFSDFTPFFQ